MYLLIDLNFVMFQALHAKTPPMTHRAVWAGRDILTSTARLAALRIFNAIKQVESWEQTTLSPKHIWLCDDVGKSFRKTFDSDYKANRPKSIGDDHEFKDMFFCKTLVRAMLLGLGGSCIGCNTYEADDVIGALSAHLKQKKVKHYVLSTDMDLFQILSGPYARIIYPQYNRSGYDIVSEENLLNAKLLDGEPWLVKNCWDVILYKILVGDPSDNWKGMPGFGRKAWLQLRNLIEEIGIQTLDFLRDPATHKKILLQNGFKKAAKIDIERFVHGLNLIRLKVPPSLTTFDSIAITKSTASTKNSNDCIRVVKGDREASKQALLEYGLYDTQRKLEDLFPCV